MSMGLLAQGSTIPASRWGAKEQLDSMADIKRKIKARLYRILHKNASSF